MEGQPEAIIYGKRHILVILMGMFTAIAVLIILGAALTRSSWWYAYPTDRLPDVHTRVRIRAIRDELEASSRVPEAVRWLDSALQPGADATAVRICLINALEALEAAGYADLAEAAQELRVIIASTEQK